MTPHVPLLLAFIQFNSLFVYAVGQVNPQQPPASLQMWDAYQAGSHSFIVRDSFIVG